MQVGIQLLGGSNFHFHFQQRKSQCREESIGQPEGASVHVHSGKLIPRRFVGLSSRGRSRAKEPELAGAHSRLAPKASQAIIPSTLTWKQAPLTVIGTECWDWVRTDVCLYHRGVWRNLHLKVSSGGSSGASRLGKKGDISA